MVSDLNKHCALPSKLSVEYYGVTKVTAGVAGFFSGVVEGNEAGKKYRDEQVHSKNYN